MRYSCPARRDESRRQLQSGLVSPPCSLQADFGPSIAFHRVPTLKCNGKWKYIWEMVIGSLSRSCGLYLGAGVIESPGQNVAPKAITSRLTLLGKAFLHHHRSYARHNEYAYRHWAEARHPDEIRQKLPSASIWRAKKQLYTPLPSHLPLLPPAFPHDVMSSTYTENEKSSLKNEDVSVGVISDDNINFHHEDVVPNHERRQIGLFSAVFIIFNRIIGTGCVQSFSSGTLHSCCFFFSVFATPSSILHLSGSVGLSL